MNEIEVYEKTKEHLAKMFDGFSEDSINEMIEYHYKYFNHISQPIQKAVAIAAGLCGIQLPGDHTGRG